MYAVHFYLSRRFDCHNNVVIEYLKPVGILVALELDLNNVYPGTMESVKSLFYFCLPINESNIGDIKSKSCSNISCNTGLYIPSCDIFIYTFFLFFIFSFIAVKVKV